MLSGQSKATKPKSLLSSSDSDRRPRPARIKKKEKPTHECMICKKVFSTKGNLVQHVDTHVDIDDDNGSQRLTTFECDVCANRFLQKRYLLAHKTRCPSKKEAVKKTHHCGLCGKIFSRLSHLRRHQSHHLKQNSFVCTICERAFVQQHHLERHFRSQAHQQKQLQVEERSQTSTQSSTSGLLQEQCAVQKPVRAGKLAKNIRRHKCPFCSKSFSTAWEMQRHWRTVHPYAIRRTVPAGSKQQSQATKTTFLLKCTRCGVRFDNDLLYHNHTDWHQGVKPHKCELCNFAFPRRLELENHKAAKHGVGWMFECIKCGGKFAQRTEIDRHLKAVHGSRGDAQSTKLERRRNDLMRTQFTGAILQCKYCGTDTYGVADYRDHLATGHFRKTFVEQATPNHSAAGPCPPVQSGSPTAAVVSLDQDGDQNSNTVKLVVSIDPKSQPVRVLRLGPTLPEWLLKLHPAYAMLDVALDEGGQALVAGESIVVQLPVPALAPAGSVKSKTIRLVYSD